MFNDQLGDFELKFSYKFISDEGNTGVEVRSHPVKGKASRLHGYHADIGHVGIGDKVLGAWDFHENNRGDYLAKEDTELPSKIMVRRKLKKLKMLSSLMMPRRGLE